MLFSDTQAYNYRINGYFEFLLLLVALCFVFQLRNTNSCCELCFCGEVVFRDPSETALHRELLHYICQSWL